MPFPKNEDRCQHHYVDGRRCRMFRMEGHPYLCPHHWEQQERLAESCRASLALIPGHIKLRSAHGVNEVLANLLRLVSQGRISGHRANQLAFIGKLLLASIPQLKLEERGISGDLFPYFRAYLSDHPDRCPTDDKWQSKLIHQRLIEMGVVAPPPPPAEAEAVAGVVGRSRSFGISSPVSANEISPASDGGPAPPPPPDNPAARVVETTVVEDTVVEQTPLLA